MALLLTLCGFRPEVLLSEPSLSTFSLASPLLFTHWLINSKIFLEHLLCAIVGFGVSARNREDKNHLSMS